MADIRLFNNNLTTYNMPYQEHLLEQYKLCVEMADRISQRRMGANKFFISLNIALITAITYFKGQFCGYIFLIPFAGASLAIFWYYLIVSYEQLNAGKFETIHELEKQLPVMPYSYEWGILSCGKKKNKYWPMSKIENKIPLIFLFFYSILCIENIIKYEVTKDVLQFVYKSFMVIFK